MDQIALLNRSHALASLQLIESLNSDLKTGLTSQQIDTRLGEFGFNELPVPKNRSYILIFFYQFLNPLIYLLILASFIAFTIGNGKDSIVIIIVVVINSLIGAFQEGRAEQSLSALRKLTQLKSRVIRNSEEILIESKFLVPGDLIILTAGDAVPADARLIEAVNVKTAEAALTGESLPVEKSIDSVEVRTPLAERSSMIYAGTYVFSGRCLAVVIATGLKSEIGRIAHLTTRVSQPKTRLEKKTKEYGKFLMVGSLILFFLILGGGVMRGLPFSEILMIAMSQVVSLVPEGLSVAMTTALAVGVQRMAKKRTIVRRLSAVESLGSTTVICTDKTGTLTRNEMIVSKIYLPHSRLFLRVTGVGYSPLGDFLDDLGIICEAKKTELSLLFHACLLCNDAQLKSPQSTNEAWSMMGDPTEGALITLAEKGGLQQEKVRSQYPRISEIPFSSSEKLMATENRVGSTNFVFIKGAPEELMRYCHEVVVPDPHGSWENFKTLKLTPEIQNEIYLAAQKLADSALRVLAFGVIKSRSLLQKNNFKSISKEVAFLGLVGQMDPPREGVAQAVVESQKAGIKTIMVTGDHKATAVSIAQALSIFKKNDIAIDGNELSGLSNLELSNRIHKISVFARVHPEQKLRIVEAFQNKGHVVAMTGDGVNDAPALVKADIGVSMGITGTEVAKEASKIIITDDNFNTIIDAIFEGRLVYQNIKKLILFLFVTSIDEVIILLLALLFGYPVPLAAVKILWINLVTEGTLTINLIMEPAEGNEMLRPPLPLDEPLLDRTLLSRVPLMVLSSVASTFGWYVFRSSQGISPELIQTETFTLLAVCQWFNVLNCRSHSKSVFSFDLIKNKWLAAGLIIGMSLHFAVIYWKPLSVFFHTVPIAPAQVLIIGAVGSLVLWVEEVRKFINAK